MQEGNDAHVISGRGVERAILWASEGSMTQGYNAVDMSTFCSDLGELGWTRYDMDGKVYKWDKVASRWKCVREPDSNTLVFLDKVIEM